MSTSIRVFSAVIAVISVGVIVGLFAASRAQAAPTSLTLADDAFEKVSLPFTFDFCGQGWD